MASKERYLQMLDQEYPYEFLLRHIDNEPSLLDSRFAGELIDRTAQTAVGFALVGEVAGATKLLDLLHSHGLSPWDAEGGSYPFLKPCMYFAWEATDLWPDWIPEEERSEEKLQELEEKGREPWLERFAGEWTVDEDTLARANTLAKEAIMTILPDFNGTLGGQVVTIQKLWERGEFGCANYPNGPLTVRYATTVMLWRQGVYPWPFVQIHRSAGLAMSFDIGMRLGLVEEPMQTLHDMCKRYPSAEQLEMMSCSRIAWKEIYCDEDRTILKLLEIEPERMSSGVAKAVDMLEQRLENGPRRQYKDKTLEELVHIISENTYLNCPYEGLKYMSQEEPSAPGDKDGTILPPATEKELLDLEQRLEVTLPSDYKDFLRISNGMGPIWDSNNLLRHLGSINDVKWVEPEYLQGNELPLLREYDPWTRDNLLDWPEPFPCRLISISGDRSDLWLVPKETLDVCKDYFFKTYAERSPEQQKELDRAVEETYGSVQNFRDLEWGVVSWTSWGILFVPYNGFRDLLERMAENARTEFWPWNQLFDPSARRIGPPLDLDGEEEKVPEDVKMTINVSSRNGEDEKKIEVP